MNNKNYIIIIICMTIYVFLITYENYTISNKCNKINNTLNTIILTQSKNDSLFLVHYSKCSFISNNMIKVGYDGYLKLKWPYYK